MKHGEDKGVWARGRRAGRPAVRDVPGKTGARRRGFIDVDCSDPNSPGPLPLSLVMKNVCLLPGSRAGTFHTGVRSLALTKKRRVRISFLQLLCLQGVEFKVSHVP